MAERDDDLLTPTLGDVRPLDGLERPWRVSSQFYVSFFGGPLAAATIGVLNGRRLGLERERLAAIAAVGIVAFVAAIAVLLAVASDVDSGRRLALAGGGVAAYLGSSRLQRAADRRYLARRLDAEPYASLWLPGLAIAIGVGLLSAGIVEAVR